MGKYIILLSFLLASCASRKVSVSKSEVKYTTDSTVIEQKDSVVYEQKALYITETADEIELTPIDTAKPIQVNSVKYFNAKVKIKKNKKVLVDTTKTVSSNVSINSVAYKKQFKEDKVDKQVDKKANYFIYLWLLIIPVLVWIGKKFLLKF